MCKAYNCRVWYVGYYLKQKQLSMPNHIKNRITLKTNSAKLIETLISTFGTIQPASLVKSNDGLLICSNEAGEYGWLDERTGIFSRRGEQDVIGVPLGFELKISPQQLRFPDFNKIVPQPENIFNGPLGQKERAMCLAEGRPNWYDWNKANWGTKWNCYACERLSHNVFTFETAWRSVPGLIRKMSENFNIDIIYEYADEDTGSNVGAYTFRNGVCVSHNIHENGSKAAYDLAFDLRPHYKDDFIFINGRYKVKDE